MRNQPTSELVAVRVRLNASFLSMALSHQKSHDTHRGHLLVCLTSYLLDCWNVTPSAVRGEQTLRRFLITCVPTKFGGAGTKKWHRDRRLVEAATAVSFCFDSQETQEKRMLGSVCVVSILPLRNRADSFFPWC